MRSVGRVVKSSGRASQGSLTRTGQTILRQHHRHTIRTTVEVRARQAHVVLVVVADAVDEAGAEAHGVDEVADVSLHRETFREQCHRVEMMMGVW